MLSRLIIRNFKLFEEAVIDLDSSVVFIGPNNSGKTTALQALALWDIGLRQWISKRVTNGEGKGTPEKRPGVAINRKDLISIPIPHANLLWKGTHTRNTSRKNGKTETQNIRIDIYVHGITDGKEWKCGLEFDYANEESLYCRPLRKNEVKNPERIKIPDAASKSRIAYLPPMSGLSDREFVKQDGEISVLIGQGQTAQVLRNLCYKIFADPKAGDAWHHIISSMNKLFGIQLQEPLLYPERSEIMMSYKDSGEQELDISCSGRGVQQTLLLLAHLYANPNSILLLDEPDAHLEILRQRQIYNLIVDIADKQKSQIIAASHSEVVLNEAADSGRVIAFVGKPHPLTDKGSQVLKSLRDIGFDQYYQAEQTGWVLYLEDATDLLILQELAKKLKHPVQYYLERVFVNYVSCDIPQKARHHFYGLREGKNDLVGIALFDRIDRELDTSEILVIKTWKRREIENYFVNKDVLLNFAESLSEDVGPLFDDYEKRNYKQIMETTLEEIENALRTINKEPWSDDLKVSDEFLEPLFRNFSKKLDVPLILRKRDYYKLVRFVNSDDLDKEIYEKFDEILTVAKMANPG